MRKIGADTIMQQATSNVWNVSSKWAPLKWDLIFIKRIYDLIHKFSRLINLFSKRFDRVLIAFIRFLYTYICFDRNYRMVVVVSMQMLLAQRIMHMAYFRPYYYYSYFQSIIKIYNQEETCCYARPPSVIINSNTGLKCWPCRGRTPSCHYQAFLTEYAGNTTFAWIFDVVQLKNRLNKNFRHEYSCQLSKICETMFSTVGR